MRVLIVKLGALGDVVMATSLVRAIQIHHQADEVWLLTSPAYASLFKDWSGLHVQAFARRGAMLAALRWMRELRFRRVFDLQSNDRSGVLLALSGIRERIGNHARFPYTRHPAEAWQGQCHIFERMNQVLAAGGVAPARARPELPASDATRKRVDEWMGTHQLAPRQFALLHAGASRARPGKRWPHFLELAGRLSEQGLACVWLGAEDDRAANQRCAQHVGVDATGAFSIVQLAELGRRARLAVTNDSGPMHVLSAADIPVFALFGPSDWRRNHALGQAQNVITANAVCNACAAGDPGRRADHRCLEGIPARQVLERIQAAGLLPPA